MLCFPGALGVESLLVIVRSTGAGRANHLWMAMHTRQRGEQSKDLPLPILVRQPGDRVSGTDPGSELEVDGNERQIREWRIDLGRRGREPEPSCFGGREGGLQLVSDRQEGRWTDAHLGSLGNGLSTGIGPEVAGEDKRVAPETVGVEEGSEGVAVCGCGGLL